MNRKQLVVVWVVLLALALPGVMLAQGGGTLTFGQPVTGEITAENFETRYAFEGTAGDVIMVSMTAQAPGLDSYVELLGPDGTSLQFTDDGGGNLNSLLGPYRLPETGTYSVIATRFMRDQGGSTGAYTLVINRASLSPLTLNETLTVELTDAQPAAYFSYNGTAGEILSAVAVNTGDAGAASGAGPGMGAFYIEARDPSGMIIRNAGDVPGTGALLDPLPLGQDGEYLFAISRQSPGGMPAATTGQPPVTVQLTVRPVQAAPIEVGQSVTGTLNDENPTDHYTFTGNPSDLLRLDVNQGAAGNPVDMQVTSVENGGYLGGNNTASSANGTVALDPLQINEPGTYLIVVSRFSNAFPQVGGLTADYSLTLGPTQVAQLEPGMAVEGAFTDPTVFEQVYRYAGSAGQMVRFTLRSLNDGYAPGMDVQGPTDENGMQAFYANFGSPTPGTFSYETTLPADGVYLLRVRNGALGYMGPGASEGPGGQFSLMIELVGGEG